jgi:membrane protease YdiL (CAAX protease family)
MSRNGSRRIKAFGLAGALVAWSFTAGLEHPWRRHPVTQAALGTALALITRAPLGLRPPSLNSGVRWGAAAAVAVTAAIVSATACVPRVRVGMAERELPPRPGRWLAVEIPLGTVWSEEMAFRGALASVAGTAFGPIGGRLLQAIAFGLSHIPDARANSEPITGTVVVTGLAGWLLGWLAQRSGSLAAAMLAHLAINEAGAVAALAAQRRSAVGKLANVKAHDETASR